jgi:hypothetical protein
MLLTDVWLLQGFLGQHPPVDLLFAAFIGWKTEPTAPTAGSLKEARKANSQALATLPPRKGKAKTRTLEQMPAFLRTPDQLKMVEEMRQKWQTS